MTIWGQALCAFACYIVAVAGLVWLFPEPVKLWQRGRWALIFEPCDFWVDGYYDREDRRVYVILIPMFPLRYSRS